MCLIRVRAKLCRSGPDLRMPGLDPEYKTTVFFQMYFQEKNIVLYSGQYGIYIYIYIHAHIYILLYYNDFICFSLSVCRSSRPSCPVSPMSLKTGPAASKTFTGAEITVSVLQSRQQRTAFSTPAMCYTFSTQHLRLHQTPLPGSVHITGSQDLSCHMMLFGVYI